MEKTFEELQAELKEASAPLRKWLSDNVNPHTMIVVDSTSVRIYEGTLNVPDLNEFIKD